MKNKCKYGLNIFIDFFPSLFLCFHIAFIFIIYVSIFSINLNDEKDKILALFLYPPIQASFTNDAREKMVINCIREERDTVRKNMSS